MNRIIRVPLEVFNSGGLIARKELIHQWLNLLLDNVARPSDRVSTASDTTFELSIHRSVVEILLLELLGDGLAEHDSERLTGWVRIRFGMSREGWWVALSEPEDGVSDVVPRNPEGSQRGEEVLGQTPRVLHEALTRLGGRKAAEGGGGAADSDLRAGFPLPRKAYDA